MSFWNTVVQWGEDLEAFVGSFAKSEVTAITPLAQESIAELTAAEAAAMATGDAKDTGHILASVVSSTSAKLAVAGLTASNASLAGAVGAAVAKHAANSAKTS